MNQNRNIMLEIEKKNLNTTSLADSMKVLGKFINRTANVRFGKVKEEIINHCREAIKKKDFPKIVSIMEQGKAAIMWGFEIVFIHILNCLNIHYIIKQD